MAKKFNLTVLIDLHGAPGSQNGIDHSGLFVCCFFKLNLYFTFVFFICLFTLYENEEANI
jgi:hypothetical protein